MNDNLIPNYGPETYGPYVQRRSGGPLVPITQARQEWTSYNGFGAMAPVVTNPKFLPALKSRLEEIDPKSAAVQEVSQAIAGGEMDRLNLAVKLAMYRGEYDQAKLDSEWTWTNWLAKVGLSASVVAIMAVGVIIYFSAERTSQTRWDSSDDLDRAIASTSAPSAPAGNPGPVL